MARGPVAVCGRLEHARRCERMGLMGCLISPMSLIGPIGSRSPKGAKGPGRQPTPTRAPSPFRLKTPAHRRIPHFTERYNRWPELDLHQTVTFLWCPAICECEGCETFFAVAGVVTVQSRKPVTGV